MKRLQAELELGQRLRDISDAIEDFRSNLSSRKLVVNQDFDVVGRVVVAPGRSGVFSNAALEFRICLADTFGGGYDRYSYEIVLHSRDGAKRVPTGRFLISVEYWQMEEGFRAYSVKSETWFSSPPVERKVAQYALSLTETQLKSADVSVLLQFEAGRIVGLFDKFMEKERGKL